MNNGNRKDVGDVLAFQAQYLVPFFQREYSWKRQHWTTLWDDIYRLISGDNSIGDHFFGPVVISERESGWGVNKQYIIIDGQQRLTTISTALIAVRDVASAYSLGTLAEKVEESYLVHRHDEGLDRYRLLPRPGDREVYIDLVEARTGPTWSTAGGIRGAYSYFFGKAMQFVSGADLAERRAAGIPTEWAAPEPKGRIEQLLSALARGLDVVLIETSKENPFEIFESLNYKGEPLSEGDLIRNNVFMGVGLTDQDAFNMQHWEPFESKIRDRSNKERTAFYRNFLAREGDFSQKGQTFVDYKSRMSGTSPEQQAEMLSEWVDYQIQVWDGGPVGDNHIDHALAKHAALGSGPSEALVMSLLDRWRDSALSKADLLQCLTDLDSFILRRALTGEPTKWLDRWMPSAIAAMKEAPLENLRAFWFKRGWPTDAEFSSALLHSPLYSSDKRKTRLILDELERVSAGNEMVDLTRLSIEHVMPQKIGNGVDGKAWKEMLGGDWAESHKLWLHTLGNLTLTGYNTSLSNRSFKAKQEAAEWGLSDSRVALNRYFANRTRWDVEQIHLRGTELAKQVVQLWPRPSVGTIEASHDEMKPLRQAEKKWSSETMVMNLGARSDAELRAAASILEWAEKVGSVSWGVGSFTVRIGGTGKRVGILYLSSQGNVWLHVQNLKKSEHVPAAVRTMFAERLSGLPGISLKAEQMDESFWFPLGVLSDEQLTSRFLAAMDLLVGCLA